MELDMTVVRRFCFQAVGLWQDAFNIANTKLQSRNVKIELTNLPISRSLKIRGYRLLEIHSKKGREPIDVFRLPSTDLIKTAEKLVQKVTQHLDARDTPGIFVSPFGRKLDVRGLSPNRRIHMNKIDGSLSINGRKITLGFDGCSVQNEDRNPLSSLTICRAIENEGCIEFFDDETIEVPSDLIPLLYNIDNEKPPLLIMTPLNAARVQFYKEILGYRKP